MNKEIIFFSDLEGTLLKDDGEFDEEQFYKFGQELNKLAETSKANIDIVIISPMGPGYMTKILEQMDKSLLLIERREGNGNYAVKIVAAAADFNDSSLDFNFKTKIDRRIDELVGVRTYRTTLGSDSKANYVSGYVKTKEEHLKDEPNKKIFYIYAGNGENDIAAMNFINNLSNGLTITPANTVEKVEKIANIKSKLEGTLGITDCLKQIRMTKEEVAKVSSSAIEEKDDD